MANPKKQKKKAYIVRLHYGHKLCDTEYKPFAEQCYEVTGDEQGWGVVNFLFESAKDDAIDKIYIIDPSSVGREYSDEDDGVESFEQRAGVAVDFAEAILSNLDFEVVHWSPAQLKRRLRRMARAAEAKS